ncbi:hypothetical protein J4E91_010467 [Alternaria rosae]|nr:hypothetical protein J4E91_010467 [Alternaria rosae]
MDNYTQIPTNNTILMTTLSVAWGFHGNYDDFVKNELIPVDTPPTDESCAICRLDFAHQDQGKEEPSDEHDFGNTTQARILAAAIAAATVDETPHDNVVQIWKYRLRQDFSEQPNVISASSREYLHGQLQHLMETADITEEQPYLDQLDQLFLGGYSVSDSIDLVYQYQLGGAEARFQSKKRDIKAQLEPVYQQLNDAEQILKELALDVYQSWHYDTEQANAALLEDFGTDTPSPDEISPWLLGPIGGYLSVQTELHYARIDAEWLRKKAAWTKYWLKQAQRTGVPPMDVGLAEDEYHESTAGEGEQPSVVDIEDPGEQEEGQHELEH